MAARLVTRTVSAGSGRAVASSRIRALGLWLALGLLILVASLFSPSFARPDNLFNILQQSAVVAVAAVGVTFVMITGGVDLSIGAVISLSAVLAALLMDGKDSNIPLAVGAVVGVGLVIGLAQGHLVARWRLPAFILTLGSAIALTGVTQLVTGGTAAGIVAPGFRRVLLAHYLHVPALTIASAVVIAAGLLVQRRTLFGHHLFLVGANGRAARLSGVPVERTLVLAYAASGVTAALAGIVLLARTGVSSSYAGRGFEFDVLAAVILGGTTFEGGRGGIGGTIAGVLILVALFNLVVILGLSFNAQLIVKGAVIVGAASLHKLSRRGLA
jgi:ribose/xylose/arabinose/galactoside ABC-type transport system permease subunit